MNNYVNLPYSNFAYIKTKCKYIFRNSVNKNIQNIMKFIYFCFLEMLRSKNASKIFFSKTRLHDSSVIRQYHAIMLILSSLLTINEHKSMNRKTSIMNLRGNFSPICMPHIGYWYSTRHFPFSIQPSQMKYFAS